MRHRGQPGQHAAAQGCRDEVQAAAGVGDEQQAGGAGGLQAAGAHRGHGGVWQPALGRQVACRWGGGRGRV